MTSDSAQHSYHRMGDFFFVKKSVSIICKVESYRCTITASKMILINILHLSTNASCNLKYNPETMINEIIICEENL